MGFLRLPNGWAELHSQPAPYSGTFILCQSAIIRESTLRPARQAMLPTLPRNSAELILHYMRKRWRRYVVLFGSVIGAAACAVLVQYAMKRLVDALGEIAQVAVQLVEAVAGDVGVGFIEQGHVVGVAVGDIIGEIRCEPQDAIVVSVGEAY